MWYELNKKNGTFCHVFLYRFILRGNQHGGRKYDDLQNWLDMTSHENPLFVNHNYASLMCKM